MGRMERESPVDGGVVALKGKLNVRGGEDVHARAEEFSALGKDFNADHALEGRGIAGGAGFVALEFFEELVPLGIDGEEGIQCACKTGNGDDVFMVRGGEDPSAFRACLKFFEFACA